jgi:hypothetical protein
MIKPKIHEGERFGNLLVLEHTGSDAHHRSVWLCKCDCGNEGTYPANNLSRGTRNSCDICRAPVKIGHKYGHVTIKSYKGIDHNQFRIWLCECVCGNNVTLSTDRLREPNISCGCKNLHRKLDDGLSGFHRVLRQYKRSAKDGQREFSLTEDEVYNLVVGRCYYCGAIPSQESYSNKHNKWGKFLYNGIDRLDNLIGYHSGNVVTCCKQCNYSKRDLKYDEFISWLHRASEWQLMERV